MPTKVGLHSRLSLRSPWKATQLFWSRIKWRCWGGVWVSASESPYSYISQPRSLSQRVCLKKNKCGVLPKVEKAVSYVFLKVSFQLLCHISSSLVLGVKPKCSCTLIKCSCTLIKFSCTLVKCSCTLVECSCTIVKCLCTLVKCSSKWVTPSALC